TSSQVSNLTEIKPEEITSEAEDIIRAVVEQEKLEREEIVQPEIEQKQMQEPKDNYNEFIDFEELDEESVKEEKKEDFSRSRQDFSRDMTDRRSDFGRDGLSRRDGGLENRDRQFARPHHNDEMERRRGFVSVEPEKKPEIKPYKYTRPSLDLITTVSDDPASFNGEMTQKSVALENALESFGIPAKVQSVVIGPTVTRYEIEMPEGISVKRILSLDADIAYALSANGQIRIEAPIPGRSIVGIEVPNKKVAMVSIKDVLNAKEFSLSPSPLTFALGKDITGNVKVCNLQKMPHLLVAGTTGSGKSVCLNTIITSLLYKSSPDEVKFIMIDPKQVELSMYEGLPHMVIPKVITDPTKAVNALGWAVDEMERRFRKISDERVRNIDEYNKCEKVVTNKEKKMPYIVIIFDEFADFMAVAKNEIEDRIRRLAGKARAAGIHLILATQRPSTDVVTGTLKANLPARIAFKVAGRVDSEVILGATGAEKLLGYGDMLYKPADTSSQRIQGCYIATNETKNIVNFIIENNEETFDEEALNAINNPNKANSNGGNDANNGVDDLLPQALKICIDNGVASTTMVQRKLSIGYPRAARIIDQMEERGYIA
ncbi:MAG: DNA translocase FtsK, partial [Tyzzerella sp.]|nr:DNA translocase FtsK [Tyzzerella sp.]